MKLKDFDDYNIELDKFDIKMLNNEVVEKGVENYLSLLLVYLDCSRIIKDMRMMQTIGYPYQREISSYLYAVEMHAIHKHIWENKLLERHQANLEYEKENPPIWYGGKKAKDKWDKEHGKHPRRKKVVEGTIPGMGKEISNKERLKKLSAQFGNLTFKIKPTKKD